jgi:uncharacterized membrane protein
MVRILVQILIVLVLFSVAGVLLSLGEEHVIARAVGAMVLICTIMANWIMRVLAADAQRKKEEGKVR